MGLALKVYEGKNARRFKPNLLAFLSLATLAIAYAMSFLLNLRCPHGQQYPQLHQSTGGIIPRRGRTQLICDKRQRGIAAGNPQGQISVMSTFILR